MSFFGWRFVFWLVCFCDTPSVFGCAVVPEVLLLDSESCSYAIAGTARWTEASDWRQCFCAIAGRSRGLVVVLVEVEVQPRACKLEWELRGLAVSSFSSDI